MLPPPLTAVWALARVTVPPEAVTKSQMLAVPDRVAALPVPPAKVMKLPPPLTLKPRGVQIDGAVRAGDGVERAGRAGQGHGIARAGEQHDLPAAAESEVDALTRSMTPLEMPVPPAFVACAVSVCTPCAETVTLVLQAPAGVGGGGAEQGYAVVDRDGQARIGGVDGAGKRDGGLVALQGRRSNRQGWHGGHHKA